ncbi:uncharacterized protein [Aristolochia californica]|uniref:uncharacterized protein n=1 Tax=Aristolochia californica TaxID=171875 RepID=UPI0035DFB01A
MLAEGVLAKMKTREKKFKPIAAQVNSFHHARDPVSFPWQWTWKDASTKVQNMRHQYLLVKQKIKKPPAGEAAGTEEEFDWMEGVTHWPNFLRYKDVFGDVALSCIESNSATCSRENARNYDRSLVACGDGFDGEEHGDLGLGLGLECEGEEGEEENFEYEEVGHTPSDSRKKRKKLKGMERRIFGFVASQLARLESRAEAEEEKERIREEREQMLEQSRWERFCEWEAKEKESVESGRGRREEELAKFREWEERMERRRLEWRKRMDEMMNQHRATMDQLQSRILHDQQSVMNQLLGIVAQWTGTSAGISDHTGTGNPYLSQMMQNLHHVNGIGHSESRVGGDNHEDQFIVDG